MNTSKQIVKCSKCGLHYIMVKSSKNRVQKDYCYNCREDKVTTAALVFARMIERMIKG